jgi:hypothetical protein
MAAGSALDLDEIARPKVLYACLVERNHLASVPETF